MPSKELEYVVLYLIKKYKHEIIRDRDWWHGIPEYFINVHDYLENDTFNINIYTIEREMEKMAKDKEEMEFECGSQARLMWK